jgi:predicted short-subunit dehydrogenase-like oxidoreductase (DUF2520 family)
MQTFSGREAPDLEGVACAIEGDRIARRVARSIARELGCVPLTVESRYKTAYHAAGCLVAGHALGLVEAATQILMKSGFTRRQAVRALLPLIRQMLTNFERLGPRAAWTGPLFRGDYATVARHQKALQDFPREFGDAYRSVGFLIARVLSPQPAVMRRNLEKLAKN